MIGIKILLLFFFIFNFTVQRRKEKVKLKRKIDPFSKLPEHISKELLCVGCYGLNSELLKKLIGKKREFEVFDSLKNVCEHNFEGYCKLFYKISILFKSGFRGVFCIYGHL